MNNDAYTPMPTEYWPPLPDGATGQQIRRRKIVEISGKVIRVGGLEPKAIIAETNRFVIYRVWSESGRDLGERCLELTEFEEEFERRPEPETEYRIRQEEGVDHTTGSGPSEWATFPVWVVYRYNRNGGWQVGKYRNPEAAQAVKVVLETFTGSEY